MKILIFHENAPGTYKKACARATFPAPGRKQDFMKLQLFHENLIFLANLKIFENLKS